MNETIGGFVAQATPEEIKRHKRRCMTPNCKRRAWLEDWAGWRWCFWHWYRSMRWGGGNKWFNVKTVKIF